MQVCPCCQREIPTAKEVREHRRRGWVAWGLSMLVAVLVGVVVAFGLIDYLTVRGQLKVCQRNLAEWQKSKTVGDLVDTNERLRKRSAPAAARKDAQGK